MQTKVAKLREKIDDAIDRANSTAALSYIRELWYEDPSSMQAAFVLSRFDSGALLNQFLSHSCKVTILRSFTVEPVIPILKAAAAVRGVCVDVRVGDFNAYVQEILHPESLAYSSAPDIVVLAVQTRDIANDLWTNFSCLSSEQAADSVERICQSYENLIKVFRRNSKAALVIHTLELPSVKNKGILDSQTSESQIEAIRKINKSLLAAAQTQDGVYLLDYDHLVSRFGREIWCDRRKWWSIRLPITADCLALLADEWLRYIFPLIGKTCKALVVDLDNTLWGGVIGEDGIDGIQLGNEFPGAAYLALQQTILDLYWRGIILAVCSKNNPDDALDVFSSHAAMLLEDRHFASMKINWMDKASNIREIAKELNIGLDAIAFLDDNPTEREWVRFQLPEVSVIDLPGDPVFYADRVQLEPGFQRLNISEEDSKRGRYYADQRVRSELQQSTATLEEFFYSLQMELKIFSANTKFVSRIAQLTQKTNQFNLTTLRYSEQQISELIKDPSWEVFAAQLVDQFGDNGLIGVVIFKIESDGWEIDTFLMSCRVIGRTVETALLATVANYAWKRGAKRIRGLFSLTKKNAQVKGFYSCHGFSNVSENQTGSQWVYEFGAEPALKIPNWIKCDFVTGDD